MTRSQFAMAAVLGAALIAAPTPAFADDLSKAVEKLEAATKKLEGVEKSLTDYKSSNATAMRQIQDDVESLKIKIRGMEDEMRQLRSTIANPSSTSNRLPYDTAPRMGRVRLSNEFFEEMSIVLNGIPYRLLPGQSRTINVPAGTFTYQVLQLQNVPQERLISPGDEKPIRIYTQRP